MSETCGRLRSDRRAPRWVDQTRIRVFTADIARERGLQVRDMTQRIVAELAGLTPLRPRIAARFDLRRAAGHGLSPDNRAHLQTTIQDFFQPPRAAELHDDLRLCGAGRQGLITRCGYPSAEPHFCRTRRSERRVPAVHERNRNAGLWKMRPVPPGWPSNPAMPCCTSLIWNKQTALCEPCLA